MSEEQQRCPLCGVDLCDPEKGEGFLRTIGMCVRGVYDGILYWLCPDCGGAWHRWTPEFGWRHRRADELIVAHNAHLAARCPS